MVYEWQNEDGTVVEHYHWSNPPHLPGIWRRVFSLSFGQVKGAGGSKGGYVTTRNARKGAK